MPRFAANDGRSRVWNKPFDDPDFARLSDGALIAMALRASADLLEERGLSVALPPLMRRAARLLDSVGTTNQEVR
ncbi:MAG: hypothetical protein ACRDJV_13540 [Actinomycetota bacterium]